MMKAIAVFSVLCSTVLALNPTLNVDWDSYLGRSDLLWEWGPSSVGTTPTKWYDSAFMGNGKLGLMIRALDGDVMSGLRMDLGNSLVWDDRQPGMASYMDNFVVDQPRLPIGYMTLQWKGNLTSASMRTSLYNAETTLNATTSAGSIHIRAFACAAVEVADALIIETTTTGGEAVNWQWTPQNATSTWADRTPGYVYNPAPVTAVTPDHVTVTTQHHLVGTSHATAFTSVGDAFVIAVSDVTTNGTEMALQMISAAVGSLSDKGMAAVVAAHRQWWHNYYPASFLTFRESRYESFYWIQMYKMASATRPTRALYDLEGPWYIDGTDWPDLHWDLNLQLLHYNVFKNNRAYLSQPLWDTLDAQFDNLVNNTPEAWRHDSAAAPTGASSLSMMETCYWNYGPNCTTSPPSVTGNLLWTLQLYKQYLDVTRGAARLEKNWFPLAARAVNFYAHFAFTQPGSSVLQLEKTFSPEYSFCRGNNTNYDVALLKWGLKTVLDVAEELSIASSDIPKWTAMLKNLTPQPVDANGYMIATGCPFDHSHRHFSHLFSIWPLQLLDFDDDKDTALAETSIDHWLSLTGALTGFCRPATSVMNTILGRTGAAFSNVTYLLDQYIPPNTMYHEGENGACSETPPMAAAAIQDWMLLETNGRVHVFGGVNASLLHDVAFFHLQSPTGHLLSGVLNGSQSWVAVEPVADETVVIVPHFTASSSSSPIQWSPSAANASLSPDGSTVTLHASVGQTVVLFTAPAPPPTLVVVPSPGLPGDFNAWGMRPNTDGTQLYLSNCSHPSPNQQWVPDSPLVPGMSTPTLIRNTHTGLCVTVASHTPEDGTKVVGSECEDGAVTQLWVLEKDSSLRLPGIGSASSLCMDVPGSTGPLVDVWTCTPGDEYHNNNWAYDVDGGTLKTLDDDPGLRGGHCLSV